jgi:hypothetical protein
MRRETIDKLKKIIEKTRRYTSLYRGIRTIRILYYNYLICYWNELLKHLRGLGLLRNRKFAKIKTYQNKHVGQRCFVVCTGPSVTYEDLELLKGEITFSMNGIVKAFHKTDWRPTYYAIQDCSVYEECQEFILNEKILTSFISDRIVQLKYKVPAHSILYPCSEYKHRTLASEVKLSVKFSGNAAALIYAGYTVTYSVLQIATYMGFKEIFLLGCDCYFSPDPTKRHFVETQHRDPHAETAADRMLYAYRVAKQYADKHHIRICNATRGGHLDVFDRVSLEDILKQPTIRG